MAREATRRPPGLGAGEVNHLHGQATSAMGVAGSSKQETSVTNQHIEPSTNENDLTSPMNWPTFCTHWPAIRAREEQMFATYLDGVTPAAMLEPFRDLRQKCTDLMASPEWRSASPEHQFAIEQLVHELQRAEGLLRLTFGSLHQQFDRAAGRIAGETEVGP
jgi:hypothetical protein